MHANHVIALVMAAGRSRRFGGADKRLATLPDGRTLLAATVGRVAEVFSQARVVVREDDAPQDLGLSEDTRVIRAPRADEGLGASLADAFAVLGRDARLADVEAAAVLLGDMPTIQTATLQTLQRKAGASWILRPCHAGRPGHPVFFGRDFWLELAELHGDEGGRAVIRHHAARCREIEVDDPGIHTDIDRPGDLVLLAAQGTVGRPG
ncbi:nucleotidyltransferase family protein [Litchfieldella rifensis]|uniref:NTP transferase domain-containing protein n=1 Tax=Litchfieldella rifensis TaxID=762643 RepID=A0ABV7LPV3_9GAMM